MATVIGDKLPQSGQLVGALALAALLCAATTSAAQAQFGLRFWNDRYVIYQDDMPELINPYAIRRIIADHGYRVRGRLRRNGSVYVADVRDRRGRLARLVVDGIHGEILERFDSIQPRKPAVRRKARKKTKTRKATRGTANRGTASRGAAVSRKPDGAAGKAAKPGKTIAARPAPPIAPPAAPASAPLLSPPVVPPEPVIKKQEAEPAPARQERQKTKPVIAAPPIKPEAEKLVTPATPKGPAKPVTEVKPQESGPAVKTPVVAAKPATSNPATSNPATSNPASPNPASPNPASPYPASSTPKAPVAPLDDPGKRRDIPKPVAVAPLH